jgi:hypothetical protein
MKNAEDFLLEWEQQILVSFNYITDNTENWEEILGHIVSGKSSDDLYTLCGETRGDLFQNSYKLYRFINETYDLIKDECSLSTIVPTVDYISNAVKLQVHDLTHKKKLIAIEGEDIEMSITNDKKEYAETAQKSSSTTVGSGSSSRVESEDDISNLRPNQIAEYERLKSFEQEAREILTPMQQKKIDESLKPSQSPSPTSAIISEKPHQLG